MFKYSDRYLRKKLSANVEDKTMITIFKNARKKKEMREKKLNQK